MHTVSDLAPCSPVTFRLSSTTSAAELALMCRDAWRLFIEQSDGWGKAELGLWSFGLYAPVARHVAYAMAQRVLRDERHYKSVNKWFVARMIAVARARVLAAFASLSRPDGRRAFQLAACESGIITPCIDAFGAVGYLPTPLTDAPVDRVLSLLAADLLLNPTDFDGDTLLDAWKPASSASFSEALGAVG